jgi:hypothetical protein
MCHCAQHLSLNDARMLRMLWIAAWTCPECGELPDLPPRRTT